MLKSLTKADLEAIIASEGQRVGIFHGQSGSGMSTISKDILKNKK